VATALPVARHVGSVLVDLLHGLLGRKDLVRRNERAEHGQHGAKHSEIPQAVAAKELYVDEEIIIEERQQYDQEHDRSDEE